MLLELVTPGVSSERHDRQHAMGQHRRPNPTIVPAARELIPVVLPTTIVATYQATGAAQMCGRLVFDATRNRLLLHGGTAMYQAATAPPAAIGTTRRRLPNGWWVESQGYLRQLTDGQWAINDADTTRAFCTHVAYHDARRDRLVVQCLRSTRGDTAPCSSPDTPSRA
jgi:hypothetical protein